MAAVMRDLVEDGARQQMLGLDGSPIGAVADPPGELRPRKPVADLRIAGKQQDAARRLQLERQHQAGVVGVGIEIQRELAGAIPPVILDLPPGIALPPVAGELP